LVKQVRSRSGAIELEGVATRQRFAPEELVILPQSSAVRVGVSSGRISPEVKRDVDSHVASVPPKARRDARSSVTCSLKLVQE
jgi:hypothetical protein